MRLTSPGSSTNATLYRQLPLYPSPISRYQHTYLVVVGLTHYITTIMFGSTTLVAFATGLQALTVLALPLQDSVSLHKRESPGAMGPSTATEEWCPTIYKDTEGPQVSHSVLLWAQATCTSSVHRVDVMNLPTATRRPSISPKRRLLVACSYFSGS